MPYLIETAVKDPKYPSLCPYCCRRNAETYFSRKFSKAKWVLPLPSDAFVSYKDYKVGYPSCNRCANFFKYSKLISYLQILIPWSLFFYFISASGTFNNNLGNISLIFALVCTGISLFLLCYRFYKVLGFRVSYIGENSILYFSRSKSFSDKFAKLNNSQSVFRLLVFKFK